MMNRESKRVLIVDDDRDLRDLLADILALGGHQISTASSAMDAFAILKNGQFDLVVSDVNMPHIDGPHFYIHAVEDYPYLKDRFLFVTGSLTVDLNVFFKRYNLKCLEKPLRMVDLLQQVNALLTGHFHGVSKLDNVVGRQDIAAKPAGRF